jgi:hypothetical protein
VEAVDYVGRQVRTAEENHYRLQNFWQLGEGFEGSASDWTEYAVWLLGVIAFLFYIGSPVRRILSGCHSRLLSVLYAAVGHLSFLLTCLCASVTARRTHGEMCMLNRSMDGRLARSKAALRSRHLLPRRLVIKSGTVHLHPACAKLRLGARAECTRTDNASKKEV